MKLLVCGGRDFSDRQLAFRQISFLAEMNGEIAQVIHGAARGADTIAGEWAAEHNIPCLEFPADWQKYGKSAGPIRNQQMLDEGKPDVVLALPGGRGTAHMVGIARKAGVPVILSASLCK